MCENENTKPLQFQFTFLLHQLKDLKRSVLATLFYLSTSFFTILTLFLLAYNGFTVFWIPGPFWRKSPPKPNIFSQVREAREPIQLSSSVLFAVREESPAKILKTHLSILQKSHLPAIPTEKFHIRSSRRAKKHKRGLRSVRPEAHFSLFQTRLKKFFAGNSSTSSCKVRFFMTWISSLKSFGDREFLAVESLFKSHPKACLVIVSKSLDSEGGNQILRPLLNYGFRVMAVAPDFDYIFKETHAELWFNRLREGNVNPGEVSLGQNLSNLLRLALLYKFGGAYIDADVIVLKSFSKLRNTIGAQDIEAKTGNWSRLNNAVLIFDKKHPLLYKFIQEFALTFDGNKWGHNGPYLVSRVVSRVTGRPEFNFTVLPPSAFYPVNWLKVRSLFEGPRNESQSKWLVTKLGQMRKRTFAIHLWNRKSRKLEIEKGSIVDNIISSSCIFCKSKVLS